MKNHKLSRRHLLRGAGALLPIPLLSSLLPRAARAQAMTPPTRVIFVLQDNGTLRDEWAPTSGTGGAFTLPFVLGGLANVQSDLTVLAGIDNHVTWNHSGNGHNIGNATLLTAIARTDAANVGDGPNAGGPSIDQYIAGRLPMAPRSSVNINLPSGAFAISYRDVAQPQSSLNLWSAFNDLFGNFMGTTDPVVLERRRRMRESVIDGVIDDFRHVNTRVGVDDKRKLDQHLTLLRDLELRLALEAQGTSCATDPQAPAYVNNRPNNEHAAYLLALACACQLTHVGSYMINGPQGDPAFTVRFTGGDYHNWIHQGPDYGLDPVRRREDWRTTMNYYSNQFGQLVSRFKSTPDSDGNSLLDNSVIVWTNVFGMGSYHDFFELPVVLAGRASGRLRSGRFLDYRRSRAAMPTVFGPSYNRQAYVNETTNNLYVSLAQLAGLSDVQTFGDPMFCSGGLPGLVG
ncbi:MAG: DUF1552 domain-containing protein [Archangium sp.]|nr:DUF1552 domain-containing protein [Archangium sp.]